MNNILHTLCETYGKKHYGAIQHWLNKQYAKKTLIGKQSLTLFDVQSEMIINELQTCIDTFHLSLETLLEGVQLLPRLSADRTVFEPMVFLNIFAFKRYFERAGLQINDLILARVGDDVNYAGGNSHISYKIKSTASSEAVCAFINFTVTDKKTLTDIQGSILLDQEELEASKQQALQKLFGGVNTLTPEEWLAHAFCLLLKRVLSDASSVSVLKTLDKGQMDKIKDLIVLSEMYYSKSTNDSETFYRNDYGRVIGRIYHRFDAVDRLKNKQSTATVHSIDKRLENNLEQNPPDKKISDLRPKTPKEKESRKTFGNF